VNGVQPTLQSAETEIVTRLLTHRKGEHVIMKPTETYDSHAWTGEEDYVEVGAIPATIFLGGLAMLLVGILF
jgi:hypothetical protein